MEDISNELLKALPLMPDAEFDCWAMRQPEMQQHAIVYKVAYVPEYITGNKQKMIECNCSACEGRFYQAYYFYSGKIGFYDDIMQAIKDGESLLCPNCGAQVRAIHTSRAGNTSSSIYAYFSQFVRVLGYAAMITWKYEINWCKDGERCVNVYPYEACVFVRKKTYFFRAWYKYFNTFTQMNYWERHNFRDYYGIYNVSGFYPFTDDMFTGTELENAKIEKFMRDSRNDECYLLEYIRTYLQHHQVENIITAGLARLINELIRANSNEYYECYKTITKGIEWKEKRPAQMLGLNKNEYAVLKKQRWSLDTLEEYKEARNSRYPVRAEEFKAFNRVISKNDFNSFVSRYKVSPIRAYNYIINQKKRYGVHGYDARILLDYYWYAEQEGYDLTNAGVAFPRDMNHEHDRLMREHQERITREKNEKEKKEMEKRRPAFDRLSVMYAPFAYASETMSIRIAASEEELIAEGKALCHCVAKYAGTHAKGDHCIFFIRKLSEQDNSFYTLELDMQTLKVLQNRGKQNCARTPEVEAFEAEWLEYIKTLKIRKAG